MNEGVGREKGRERERKIEASPNRGRGSRMNMNQIKPDSWAGGISMDRDDKERERPTNGRSDRHNQGRAGKQDDRGQGQNDVNFEFGYFGIGSVATRTLFAFGGRDGRGDGGATARVEAPAAAAEV